MKIRESIYNRLKVILDPELRAISRIIKDGKARTASGNKLTRESDEVFLRRLEVFPQALKMSFWENHFEWKSLADYPEIDGKVLDFGCGSGHLDVMLARNGRIVHGIDLSPIGISIANYLKSREDVPVQARLSFSVADVTDERMTGELYDSAWSAHVFEHIANPAPILTGLRKWLKQGACLLVSVPLGNAYDDPGHVNHFHNASQLESYLNGHVQIVRIDVSGEHQVIRALCKFA